MRTGISPDLHRGGFPVFIAVFKFLFAVIIYQLHSAREILEVRVLRGEHGGKKGKEGRRGSERDVLMGNFAQSCVEFQVSCGCLLAWLFCLPLGAMLILHLVVLTPACQSWFHSTEYSLISSHGRLLTKSHT